MNISLRTRTEPSKTSVLRITPARGVRNNETRRLYSALYDLFLPNRANYISTLAKRATGTSREPQRLWWIVRLEADTEGNRKIEFFTAMPETYADAYKTKFRGHEGWKSCTLETDDQSVPAHDMIATDIYKLQYKRHDMFSLGFDYSEQETPIKEVMSVIHEMKPGESVTLFIRMESVGRKKWKDTAEYAWEQWKKGGMAHRAGFDPARVAKSAYALGEEGFHRGHDFVTDVLGAFKRQFFSGEDGDFSKKERKQRTNHEREELLVNGDLSTRTKNKRNLPVFKTSIRMTVTSADPVRREMLARSLANACEHTSKDHRWKDNVLVLSKVKMNARRELANLAAWQIKDLDPLHMSVDEIGKLCQLPTPALQEEFKDCLASNQRTEVEVPKIFLEPSGILVGTATDKGVIHNIHIPTVNKDFLFTPRVPCGSPRMGKDQFIVNLIVEAKRKHGVGAVVPDFIDEQGRTTDGKHWRGMANAIRDALPPEDVVDVNLADTSFSFSFGLESVFKNATDLRIVADVIAEYMADFLMSDGDEDKFQTSTYLRSAAKVAMGDLLGIKHMFLSQEYRGEKIKQYADVFDMDLWIDYNGMSDGKQGQIYGPILRRLNQILESEYLKPMFTQQTDKKKASLYDWVSSGKVVLLRMKMPPPIPMPERIKELLAYWVTMETFLINLSLGGDSPGSLFVLNEPHQFLSRGMIHFLKRALAEGPKYRFAPVISFHFFSQFDSHPGFVDMLLAANCNWHLFKNSNVKVYEKLMFVLSKTFETPQQAFDATKAFQYIACWTQGGEYQMPFVCDALPMVNDRYAPHDNSNLTRDHIRLFGRKTDDVLAEIRKRNKMSFQTSK